MEKDKEIKEIKNHIIIVKNKIKTIDEILEKYQSTKKVYKNLLKKFETNLALQLGAERELEQLDVVLDMLMRDTNN